MEFSAIKLYSVTIIVSFPQTNKTRSTKVRRNGKIRGLACEKVMETWKKYGENGIQKNDVSEGCHISGFGRRRPAGCFRACLIRWAGRIRPVGATDAAKKSAFFCTLKFCPFRTRSVNFYF